MSHPHKSMLDEFQYAIDHFVSTLPDEVKMEADKLLKDLSSNQTADEDAIKKAFHDIGVKEYPHRKAYQELTLSSAGDRINDLVIEHIEDDVKKVVKPLLDSGVSLNELTSSEMFEKKLTPEQRYQIEDGIMVAKSKLADELDGKISEHSDEYQVLLKKWQGEVGELEAAIKKLEGLAAQGKGDQKQEILDKAKRYKQGFLLTERDPELGELKKEIEYWEDSFKEDE
jgi:hypothetical protein